MNLFASDPVGLPGLAALMAGFTLFVVALLAARNRGTRTPEKSGGQRSLASWGGIMTQGLSFFIVSFGPQNISLGPLSPLALGEAALIALLMATSVALFTTASRAMGQNWALVARTRYDHTLVTNGPFAYVRHPIYVAMFCCMVALAIAFGHSARLLIGVPVFAIGTWRRIAHEERLLRNMFGASYDAYAARVKRFVPGVF